jgi:3-hydroxyisobutyrate dehydrogenase-like beta-hydroxyacid dehydrogenase/GNAT superfamily N-acetyltransferase
MTRQPKIGLLHPGEMGISIAASAQNSGCEVYWASEGRSDATRKRAAEYGLSDSGTVGKLAETCEVIICICPPHAAEDVARQVLDSGFQSLYVDANAISPERTIGIGTMLSEGGIGFVDGGIVGKPAWKTATTWLHLSGERATKVAECFRDGPLHTTDLGPAIGRASAMKMCFAANTKGTTALLTAIVGAAEQLGIREDLERQWDALNPGMADQVSERIRSVARKAWRFAGEMDEISATFRAARMPGEFHAGAHEIYRRLSPYKDVRSAPELSELIRVLLDGVDSPEEANSSGGAEIRSDTSFEIAPATEDDIPRILELIRGLADYEHMSDQVSATEEQLGKTLFGTPPAAEVLLGRSGGEAVGLAIFFQSYSTFLARPGLYLEDLFVLPEWRGRGLGHLFLEQLAAIAIERDYGRLEWSVLDWNTPAIDFYRKRGVEMIEEWNLCRMTGTALEMLGARATRARLGS